MKKIKNKKRFFISFIEEGILNEKYRGYIGGRVEVYDNDDDRTGYAINEIRFFTKNRGWYSFRDKWDFKDVTKDELDEVTKMIEKKYNIFSKDG